jgi:hypothetical protein
MRSRRLAPSRVRQPPEIFCCALTLRRSQSGSPSALLRRCPLRTVRATRRGTRLKQAVTIPSRSRRTLSSSTGGRRPRFCSPHGCLTCPSAPAKIDSRRHGSPASRQPFAAGQHRPGLRPVIRQHPVGGPAPRSRFPAAIQPPAFASWASCSRHGIQLPSRSACRPTPRRRHRTPHSHCDQSASAGMVVPRP